MMVTVFDRSEYSEGVLLYVREINSMTDLIAENVIGFYEPPKESDDPELIEAIKTRIQTRMGKI